MILDVGLEGWGSLDLAQAHRAHRNLLFASEVVDQNSIQPRLSPASYIRSTASCSESMPVDVESPKWKKKGNRIKRTVLQCYME